MDGLRTLVILGVLEATLFNGGFAHPPQQRMADDSDLPLPDHPYTYPPEVSAQAARFRPQSEGCFHFYLSRNMSSLLAEATHRLQGVQDPREREWILTFVFRIKALAEHLRTHPDSRNYNCLPTEDESRAMYFDDDMLPSHVKRNSDATDELTPGGVPPGRDLESSGSAPDPGHRSGEELLEELHDLRHQGNPKEEQPPDEASPEEAVETDEQSRMEEQVVSAPVPDPQISEDVQGKEEDRQIETLNHGEAGLHQNEIPQRNEDLGETSDSGSIEDHDSEEEHRQRAETSGNGDLKRNEVHDQEKETSSRSSQDLQGGTGAEDQTHQKIPPPGDLFKGFILSSPPDCEEQKRCDELMSSAKIPENDDLVQQLHSGQFERVYMTDEKRDEILKQRIRNALKEELVLQMKKLQAVGGSLEDLVHVWEQVEKDSSQTPKTDFENEEDGAAVGNPDSKDDSRGDSEPVVAPSIADARKESAKQTRGDDDEQELVRQMAHGHDHGFLESAMCCRVGRKNSKMYFPSCNAAEGLRIAEADQEGGPGGGGNCSPTGVSKNH